MTSRHDYEIWEIIWAHRFDLSNATQSADRERFKDMIEFEMNRLNDKREPEPIAWWDLDLPER
jgi:hypothetical protein